MPTGPGAGAQTVINMDSSPLHIGMMITEELQNSELVAMGSSWGPVTGLLVPECGLVSGLFTLVDIPFLRLSEFMLPEWC